MELELMDRLGRKTVSPDALRDTTKNARAAGCGPAGVSRHG
jgi:hypothetical protein